MAVEAFRILREPDEGEWKELEDLLRGPKWLEGAEKLLELMWPAQTNRKARTARSVAKRLGFWEPDVSRFVAAARLPEAIKRHARPPERPRDGRGYPMATFLELAGLTRKHPGVLDRVLKWMDNGHPVRVADVRAAAKDRKAEEKVEEKVEEPREASAPTGGEAEAGPPPGVPKESPNPRGARVASAYNAKEREVARREWPGIRDRFLMLERNGKVSRRRVAKSLEMTRAGVNNWFAGGAAARVPRRKAIEYVRQLLEQAESGAVPLSPGGAPPSPRKTPRSKVTVTSRGLDLRLEALEAAVFLEKGTLALPTVLRLIQRLLPSLAAHPEALEFGRHAWEFLERLARRDRKERSP